MKVHAIRKTVASYVEFLESREGHRWTYLYSIIKHFHIHWDPLSSSLATCFDQSLKSDVSRRIWRRESFDARSMMLKFIEIEPDYVRQMFRDLYDESKAVDARIDRFRFYCDELLQLIRQHEPNKSIPGHDQDATMISFYLSGRYPDKYAIYPGFAVFEQALRQFESPKQLQFDDLDRFFKVCNAINTIGRKDPVLQEIWNKRFEGSPEFGQYLQWTSEMILATGRNTLF